MEYNTKRTLVLISAILMAISAVSLLVSMITLFVSPSIFLTSFIEVFEEMQLETEFYIEIEQLVLISTIIMSIIYSISFVLSIICSVFYFIRYKATEQQFIEKKASYIVITVLNVLFIGNYIAFITALIPLLGNKQETKEMNIQDSDEDFEYIANQIQQLKELRQSGAITEQEYAELLSNIIK